MQEASYAETKSSKGYIQYGEDNKFPEYLLSLYNNSAIHHALCDGIAYMIHGEGYRPVDIQASLKYETHDLDNVLLKCALDYTIHGGFALEVNWSLDRTYIDSIYHCPFENLRSGEADDDGEVNHYYYSADWFDTRKKTHKIPAWNPEYKVECPRQIMYVKPFSAGSFYYPKPSYVGAINYIELDREIALFHVNNIRNGLMPSFMINFKNGEPNAIERSNIRAEIEAQISGASNAGKWFMTFNDQPERAPDFIPFPTSDNDTKYQFLAELATEKIMMGHRVTNPMMFGLLVPGRLGGGGELAESKELFNTQVINPARKIFKSAIRDLYSAMDLNVYWSMSKQDTEMSATNWLVEKGEVMDGYDLIQSSPVDYETDDALGIHLKLASVVRSTGVEGDKGQDNELFKIRYRYRGMPTTTSSRDFCRQMMSADRVYKKDDILAASKLPVNRGFGEGGSSTYDIWIFKGGARCGHFWEREVFLKSDNDANISVNKARKMIMELPLRERGKVAIPVNERRVSAHPNDMVNKGFAPSNSNMPADAKAKTSGL